MRKTHLKWLLLMAVALFVPWSSMAQAVHGVDGYYNFTPTQIQADGVLQIGGNGKKFSNNYWHPEAVYTDDMQYIKFIMGVNDAAYKEDHGGYNHRSAMGIKELTAGEGAMTITKKYPVLAMKVSLPYNATDLDSTFNAYWETEFRMYNPVTGNKERLPLNGLDNNGRFRFVYTNPIVKDAFGRDSAQLNKGNNGYDAYRMANAVHSSPTNCDKIWHIVRVDASANEKADIILAMDLSMICAQHTAEGGIRMLDTTDIKLVGFEPVNWINVYADTLYYDEDGVAHVKTKDQMPTCYLKWIKTFDSMEAFDASLTAEAGYGDNYAGIVEEEPAPAVYRDVKLDLAASTFLEEAEKDGNTNVTLGVAVAEDGTITRVDADAVNANAVLAGKYHNDHGWTGVTLTIDVEGPTKVGIGNCSFSGHTASITDAAGNKVEINVATSGCWSRNKTDDNVTYGYYKGEATTLTISSSSYTPYISVEAVALEDIPNEIEVSFAAGSETINGVLPAGFKAEIGKEYTLPVNRQMYVEGKTLTGWNNGTETLAPGAVVVAGEAAVEYTPVYTENSVSLADRTEAVTINWDFQQKNGAPIVAYEGSTGIWVAQAVVNGETIDVKLDFDASNGKIANGNWQDWAQMNEETKLVVPACKGAVISLESYNATTTTTIAGETINQGTTTPSYTYEGDAETVEIVIGDGSYFRYIQAVLPVVETSAIMNIENNSNITIVEIYSITGERLTVPRSGQINILKLSNGKVIKAIL